MKVLVTGASGGLGELVINALLENKMQVVATSRDAEKIKNASFYDRVTYKPYTISGQSSDNLFEYFDRPNALIHLAWDKLNEYKNPLHLGEILESHKHFLSNLFDNGLKDFTGIGTCYEYGLREGMLEETQPSVPILPYPQGKNMLREFVDELQKKHGFSHKWVRIFYVFGEVKERKNLYTHLMQAVKSGETSFNMSGGEQVRDFLSPLEIARIIVAVATQKKVEGIINCCSGKPVKLKDFVLDFLKKNGYDLKLNLGYYPYADYEPMNTWGSVAKLQRIVTK